MDIIEFDMYSTYEGITYLLHIAAYMQSLCGLGPFEKGVCGDFRAVNKFLNEIVSGP